MGILTLTECVMISEYGTSDSGIIANLLDGPADRCQRRGPIMVTIAERMQRGSEHL